MLHRALNLSPRALARTASALSGIAFVVSVATVSFAQDFNADVRIDQMQPASAGSPFPRSEGPRDHFTNGIGYAFRIVGDYALDPLRTTIIRGAPNVAGQNSNKSLVHHAVLLHLGASIQPLHWLTVEANVPVAVFEQGEADRSIVQQPLEAGSAGPGDFRVGVHFIPVNSKHFDFALGGRFWAPSGDRAAYLRGPDPKPRAEAVLAVAGEHNSLQYGCTAGIAPMIFAGRDGDRAALSCGTLYKFAPFISLGVEPHVALFTYADDGGTQTPGLSHSSATVQFEPLGSLNFHLGDFTVGLTGGAGLGNAPGTASARGLLSLSYADHDQPVIIEAPAKDSDLDGLADTHDACPNAAGPRGRRGCPTKKDLDGDSLLDDDACPTEAGPKHDDPKASGCPDRDNDHFPDPIDPCPDEPGVKTGGCPRFARLKDGDFVIKPPIRFYRGNDRLPKKARAALQEVIQTMRANPQLERLSITIGSKRSFRRLTDLRARRILLWLKDDTFDSNRIEVVLDDKLQAGLVTVRVIR